jgi:hypothetical protein
MKFRGLLRPLSRFVAAETVERVVAALSVAIMLSTLASASSQQTPPPKGKQGAKQLPAPPPPPPPWTSSIAGTVTSLIDGKPIARARVVVSSDDMFVCPAGTPVERQSTCPRFRRTVLTNADGTYVAPDLPPSKTFVVTVSKTGYAARAYGETPPAVPPSYVSVLLAERKEKIDVQLVVHNFVSGRLLDEDKTPFAGALVEALRAVYENGQRKFVSVAQSVTDDLGQFRLYGLPPGQYFVSAFDPAFAEVGDSQGLLFYGPTFYPGTLFQDEATRITLDPGQPSQALEFQIKIVRPARVTGKLDAGAILLAGAVNIGQERGLKNASYAVSDVDIKPDGIFQFANILAGKYIIRARGETERQGVSMFQQYSVPVQGFDVTGISMDLVPGAVIRGSVQWEGKKNAPPTDRSQIRVRSPMMDGSMFGDALTGNINADRSFELRGVMAGFHTIRVEGLPPEWQLKKVLMFGGDVTDIPIEFSYRQVIEGIQVILTDEISTLAGTVSTDPSDVAQGYAVVAFPTNSIHWQPASRFVKLTYVDDRGRYLIRGLPPASYYVAVARDVDESDLGTAEVLERLSRTAATVKIDQGGRKTQSLRAVMPLRNTGR